jgi:hypothetical protein
LLVRLLCTYFRPDPYLAQQLLTPYPPPPGGVQQFTHTSLNDLGIASRPLGLIFVAAPLHLALTTSVVLSTVQHQVFQQQNIPTSC